MKQIELSKMHVWLHNIGKNNKELQRYASDGLAVIMLIWSAWLVGKIVWMLPADSSSVVTWKPSASGNTPSHSKELDLSNVHQSHLFGQYQANTDTKPKPVVQDAPKTQLNLILVGVVASSERNLGLAVIANRGQQATYGISERIEGTRAKLKAVLNDRVIIDNAGRDETLMLEGIDYKKLEVSEPRRAIVSNVQGNNPASAEDKIETIRNEITENPQKIFDYVRLSQVKKDDQVIGYRVSPGQDPELFNSVGLQNGDIAIRLNGEDLTDKDSMGKIFQNISELTELSLTVERDGQQHDIYIEF